MSSSGDPELEPSRLGRRSWSDLGPRLGSAAVLIAVTATALVLGSFPFAVLVGGVFAGVYREWETMIARRPLSTVAMVLMGLVVIAAAIFPLWGPYATFGVIATACLLAAASGGEGASWRVAGLLFFGLVIVSLLTLRGSGSAGIGAGVFLGTVVWMTDSAAFFTGRQVGGEKLAPDISPSKTWSGALGGLALGTVAGAIVWMWVSDSPLWIGVLFAASISVLGQLGDLTESAVKRHFRIKDSGDLIPGHGGLMDRLDSLTLAAIFVCLVGAIHSGFTDVASGFLNW